MRSTQALRRDYKSALQRISSLPPYPSFLHTNFAQIDLYERYRKSKPCPKQRPIQQDLSNLQLLRPQTFRPQCNVWVNRQETDGQCLDRGCILRVVSWNIFMGAWAEKRASTALGYLQSVLGNKIKATVIMLQEVRHESLQAILNNQWVQRNFDLSNTDPPQSIFTDIPDISFSLKLLEWEAAPYFTMMLISKDLSTITCFRAPFATDMGRDALVMDIPIANKETSSPARECLRLCTTHLESLWDKRGYRSSQLDLVSAIVKGEPPSTCKIIAGLVGGDMNSIDKTEHELHKGKDIDMNDVWEDAPAPPTPKLKPFQREMTYGRAKGNTYGYQSKEDRERKRLDKFLYTGSLEMIPLNEFDDTTGKLSRLGLGLKTEVDAWERESSSCTFKRGKLVHKTIKEFLPLNFFSSHPPNQKETRITQVKHHCWVSDHFGIAVDQIAKGWCGLQTIAQFSCGIH